MASKFDPTVLIGAALGAATIALGKHRDPITPAQMLGNMCAAFAFGYYAPDLIQTYYPTAANFVGFVAFVCALLGVGLSSRIVVWGPRIFDKIAARKAEELSETSKP